MFEAPLTTKRRIQLRAELLAGTSYGGDRLVHALAQLPDAVELTLPARLPSRAFLELLGRAYGIGDRLHFYDRDDEAGDPTPHLTRLIHDSRPLGEVVEALTEPDDPPATVRVEEDAIFSGERIAFVTNLPAHYRATLLAEMSKRVVAAGGDFRVFFLGRGDADRPWLAIDPGELFDHQFLHSAAVPIRARPPLVPFDLGRQLAKYRPTLVVGAGFSPFVVGRMALYAVGRRIPWGIVSGETTRCASRYGSNRQRLRRLIARHATFAIAYGSEAAAYLRALAPPLPLVIGRNTAPVLRAERPERRQDGACRFVAIGDLQSRRKGLDILIQTLRLLPDLDCELMIVGGGKMSAELQDLADGDQRVTFLGALPPDEVRRVYAGCDAVLFPTRADVFGLVLVEAMGAGLPCVVSAAAGAVADLAVDGVNALVVPSEEPQAWARILRSVAEDAPTRQALGERARATVWRRWTIEHSADAMLAGFRLGILSATSSRA